MKKLHELEKGFTIVELLIVMGIIATLFGLATISLVRTQHVASVSAAVDQLVADMRSQQTKAMTGTKDTTGNANSYGIHITANNYVLFQGAADPGDSTNFTVRLDGIALTTNLPGNLLVFAKNSGKFSNYVSGTYTITVTNSYGTEQKIVTINRYGVITSIQ
jgi:prepilin-type N-terminal cleavage/methylation domain-containing protein